jgi:hypothetical protein
MNKRYIFILLAAIIAVVVAWLLLRKPVHIAEMSETAVPSQYGLKVGPALLGWSSHANSPSERNGYIYMRDVSPSGGNKPLWEFSLSTKHRLSDVTRDDLRGEFYGMDDSRGASVFGEAWTPDGSAILVPEGQIFFARLAADHSVVYVIRLAKQGGMGSGKGTIQIEYYVYQIPAV